MSHGLIEKVIVGELPDLNNEFVEINNEMEENEAAKNSGIGHDFLLLGDDDQQECCQVQESVLFAILVCPVRDVGIINLCFPFASGLGMFTYIQLLSTLFAWIRDSVQPKSCPVSSVETQIEVQSKETESKST